MDALPPPPRGKVYQAWTLRAGATRMSPSVTFVPNRSGVAVVPVPVDASGIAAVAVSVEPDGGSKQPTSTPTFVLKLS
jgi:anti-sigma-K factor RskA